MNALRSSIRVFFAYAHRARYIAQDPARLVRRALCEAPPPRALTERDQKRLLRVLARAKGPEASRDHVLFDLMLSTGVRLGSALGMDIDDLDLRRGEIRLRSFKGGREERLYLGTRIRAHLRRFVAGRTSGPVFVGRGDARMSSRHVQRRFALWLARAGIETRLPPHALRHSFAMRVYAKTRDIHLVQQALHHRAVASTVVYARLDSAGVRRALK
jgi:integrase/recombinase XerC